MVVFLTNRANIQARRLHERIKNRLKSEFETVSRRPAEPTEPGPYRVVATGRPRYLLGVESYPTDTARLELGFDLQTDDSHEYYWINWLEPEREMLVGWHQDGTHPDLGPVHLQLNDGANVVERTSAAFVDSHPLDVVERRLAALPALVTAVQWGDGRPTGIGDTQLADDT